MKGFIAVVLFAFLAFSVYNWWEVRQLRQEIADLRTKVETPRDSGLSDILAAQAIAQFARAREALANADVSQARRSLDDARQTLDKAAKTAGEKAGPALDWLRRQAADLETKVQAQH